MNSNAVKTGISKELKRKAIHLFSSVIPLSYYFLERKLFLLLLTAAFAAMVIIDILRNRKGFVKDTYGKFLGDILRPHEVKTEKIYFTGGTYIVLAFLLCALIFEKNIAVLSMLIVVVCDSAAAITGIVYGRHFIGGKTIEGSLAFFISGIVLFAVVMKPDNLYLAFSGILSVVITALFELIPFKIDDNLSIPLLFGLVYSLLSKTELLI